MRSGGRGVLDMELETIAPQKGSLQLTYPSQFLSATQGYKTSPFGVSAPPTSLDETSLFISLVIGLLV